MQSVGLGEVVGLVTIAIPTYNRANFLKLALESALSQTYRKIEIIIYDNASIDDTNNYLRSISDPRVRVFHHTINIGMMGNWNACLSLAKGQYFILLSDDDVLQPDAIEEMLSRYERPQSYGYFGDATKIGCIYGQANIIDSQGLVIAKGKKAPDWEGAVQAVESYFLRDRQPFPCSILFRTDDLTSELGYDEKRFPLTGDAKLWMSVSLKRGVVGFVNKVCVNYRIHPSSVTNRAGLRLWMKDNDALTSYCVEFVGNVMHDKKNAQKLELAGKHFNIVNAALLISAEKSLGSWGAIAKYFSSVRMFLDYTTFGAFLRGIIYILMPIRVRSILGKISRNLLA